MGRLIEPRSKRARVPIVVWAREAPDDALAQLERVASQPYVVGRVAGMPDLHLASGVAVGTVFATDGVVVPSALGGDLGCGVCALRFALPARALNVRALEQILDGWSSRIPVGDAVHRKCNACDPASLSDAPLATRALEHERARLLPKHLGTLGGGNHFVELDRDADGAVWLLVHTGSRGLGAVINAHHARAAEASSRDDLPALAVESESGRACVSDLAWASAFAAANRRAIAESAIGVIGDVCGVEPDRASWLDVQHNFVAEEVHEGRRVWVHRKGAIAAPLGERVLIPGSMGTASYLAEGLGEASSFRSASHGAGRVMTRREAREQIGRARFAHSMRRVVHDQRRAQSLVEEAPMAYRDIAEVLEDEEDLVRPIARLEPLVVLKG